jgi:Raf kinase inhibitor-like YbhB/YbcL family protein
MRTEQGQRQEREKKGREPSESGRPGGGQGRKDEVGRSGVYPASGPLPPGGDAPIRTEAEWGQGVRGAAGYEDHGQSELMTLPPGDQLREERQGSVQHSEGTRAAQQKTITLTSAAFAANAVIPQKYTGEGEDISPPLSWSGIPQGTKALARICEDPDAPQPTPWVHWVAYNIPPTQTGLPENAQDRLVQGRNDFGKSGYGGPMPPQGHGVHHYHFRLCAVDAPMEAGPGLTKDQLLDAMRGHILAEGELVGTYERT